MKLPDTAHTAHPWRIHEIAHDFTLEDVWDLPTPGGPDDFPRLVRLFTEGDPAQSGNAVVRLLFAIRWKIGGLLGWDDDKDGVGSRVPSLRDRLPGDLRDAQPEQSFDALPFSPLYLTGDEFAAEIANQTMHGVMHLSWVPDGDGAFHGRMAVLVKENGILGTLYMAAIRPFRHLLVYPTMIRQIESDWQAATAQPVPVHA